MKNLGVLIDFTPVSTRSVEFAIAIANTSKASITLIHATSRDNVQSEEFKSKFEVYQQLITDAGLQSDLALCVGDYDAAIPNWLKQSSVDLVVTGTHGVKGIKQSLFGSNILHLLQKMPLPTLVIQDESEIPTDANSTILFPVAAHNNFMKKVNEAAEFSKIFNSKICVYTVNKTDRGPGEDVLKNRAMAIDKFQELGITHENITEVPSSYSFGFGGEINRYAKAQNVSFITILTEVSSITSLMANADKERIILNDSKIPVLCVN